MSWKSVKNILMILLLAVNVLLAYFVYDYYAPLNVTDQNTAISAAKALKNSGISVDSELLSVRNDRADILYTDFDREEYVCLAAAMLFGKEADGFYMLDGGVMAETLEGESAYIGYDMTIEFTASGKQGPTLLTKVSASSDEADSACKFIENKFALVSGSLDRTACQKSGDTVFVKVSESESGIKLYSMDSVFGVEDEKIVYASGKHFFGVPKEKESAQLLDRINILFSEKERGMQGTVKSIRLCYALYEDSESNRMIYIPSYTVTYEGGKTSIINAISKKLYQSSFQE